MRILGVNAAGSHLYFAVVEDGAIVDSEPYSITFAAAALDQQRLVVLHDDMKRVLEIANADSIRVLDAEAGYQDTQKGWRDRMALESVLELAAAERGTQFFRATRSSVRTAFGLPKVGKLGSYVSGLTDPAGRYWAGKRDLAALAALATLKGT